MKRRKQMCPNADCERHLQPTGLMGGCDCGARLVPYMPQFAEPTTEQLARFLIARKPDWVPGPVDVDVLIRVIDEDPDIRARLREQHRELQQALYDAERAA